MREKNWLLLNLAVIPSLSIMFGSIGFRVPDILLISTIVLMTTFIYLVGREKTRNICWIILLSIVVVLLVIGLIHWNDCIKYGQHSVKWMVAFCRGNAEFHLGESIPFIIVISFVFLVIMKYLLKDKRIRYLLAAVFVVNLVCCGFCGRNLSKPVVVAVFLYVILVLMELVNKRRPSDQAMFLMWPCYFIIGITLIFLPVSQEPFNWSFITGPISGVIDKIENAFDEIQLGFGHGTSRFSVRFTGFTQSDTTKLGGKVNHHNNTILTVWTPGEQYAPMYLRASISNQYISDGWNNSKSYQETYHNERAEEEMEYLERVYSIYRSGIQLDKDELLFHDLNLTITYEDMKTKSVFWPELSANDSFLKRNEIDTTGEDLEFYHIKKKGLTYDVRAVETNEESGKIISYLKSLDSFSYRIDSDSSHKIDKTNAVEQLEFPYTNYSRLLETKFNNELRERADYIKKEYVKLPNRLPKRVYELADRITKGSTTTYDKLKALQSYLRENYSYTLTPKEEKSTGDFVDTFLFRQKEGYCTYFATAMAVLARCENIPTRYVEGVVLNPSDRKDGYYDVKDSSAHAWTEAYIEGYGWIVIEATPIGFNEGVKKTWTEKSVKTNIAPTQTPNKSVQTKIDDKKVKEQKVQRKVQLRFFVLCCFAIMGSMIAFLLLYFYLIYQLYQRRVKQSTLKQLIALRMVQIFEYFDYDGIMRDEEETLMEMARRIDKEKLFGIYKMEQVSDSYYKFRYGDMQLTKEEYNYIYGYEKAVKAYIQNKYGVWRRRLLDYQLITSEKYKTIYSKKKSS